MLADKDPEALWNHYIGPVIEPEEFVREGGELIPRLRTFLEERWANHDTQPLSEQEIEALAQKLALWLKLHWW